jgi:N,N-dimethylformamidase beta subunit-like protein
VTLRAYATSTSYAQGDRMHFRVLGGSGTVRVEDAITDRVLLEAQVTGPEWTLDVPVDWPSSMYRAVFSPGVAEESAPHFVVRAAVPSAPILVSLPFATWQAYNQRGVAGQGLYFAEQPDRAARVSFDRPGAEPPPERFEHGLLRWLGPAGYQAEYCSGLDLHDGLDLLRHYRLLVVNGHDEYWSLEMRDAVEEFVRGGGNLAVFAGNTCWWQVRFEDDLRTMVCYRDAVADPLAGTDPGRTTVEWSAEPVNRPENTLIGVSFRHGAGCWVDPSVMDSTAYRVRFPAHWAFAGTGLADGQEFGRGCVGYETDAAAFTEIDGVPLATGRDGTPSSFVILATADLAHWRQYGKGGAATMGVMRLGAGTVFNAATVNWGTTLADPAVDRITRNVLDRLSQPSPPGWEVMGQAEVLAMAACDGTLFAVSDDRLLAREICPQNLRWQDVGDAGGVVAVAVPREAHGGPSLGLYGVTASGVLRYRDAVAGPASWTDVGVVPEGTVALAAVNEGMFAATSDGLWHLPIHALPSGWTRVDDLAGVTALTAANGRLFAVRGDRLLTRLPVRGESAWADHGPADGVGVLAAHMGRLIGAGGGELRWRMVHS